jgi:hypothetical protein
VPWPEKWNSSASPGLLAAAACARAALTAAPVGGLENWPPSLKKVIAFWGTPKFSCTASGELGKMTSCSMSGSSGSSSQVPGRCTMVMVITSCHAHLQHLGHSLGIVTGTLQFGSRPCIILGSSCAHHYLTRQQAHKRGCMRHVVVACSSVPGAQCAQRASTWLHTHQMTPTGSA